MSASSHGHGHSEPGADPASIEAGHELRDAKAGPLVLSALGIFGVIIVAFVGMALLMAVAGSNPSQTGNTLPTDTAAQLQVPPSPRLEQNPQLDGTRIVDEASKRLESYGWADQQAGTAHIPIERAQELLLQRGLNGGQ